MTQPAFIGDSWRFYQSNVIASDAGVSTLMTDLTPGLVVSVSVTLNESPWGGPFTPTYETDAYRWVFPLDLPGPGRVAIAWTFAFGALVKNLTQSLFVQSRPGSVAVPGESNLSWDVGPTGPAGLAGASGATGPTGVAGLTGPTGAAGTPASNPQPGSFEVLLDAVNILNIPAAETAVNTASGFPRDFTISLLTATQFRLVSDVPSVAGSAGSKLRLKDVTAGGSGTDLASSAGTGDVAISSTGITVGAWVAIAVGSRIDSCVVRLYMVGGDGAADPTLGRVRLEYK